MVYCKMKAHNEKEGETKQELCRHLQGTASKHWRKKAVLLQFSMRLEQDCEGEQHERKFESDRDEEERRDTEEGRKNGGSSRCRDVSYPIT